MKKILILIIAMFISNVAQAEWTKAIDSPTNHMTVYIDLDGMQKRGSITKMWNMNDYQQPKLGPNNTAYSSMKTFYEYDCTSRTTRLLASVVLRSSMGLGDILYSNMSPSNELEPIIPGAQSEYMWQLACGKK